MTLNCNGFAREVVDAFKQIVKTAKTNRNVVKEDELNEVVEKIFRYVDYFNNNISIYQNSLDGVSMDNIEFPKALMSFIEPRVVVKDVTMLEMCKDLKIHHYYLPEAKMDHFSVTEYYECVKDFLKLFNKWVDNESCATLDQALAPVNYSEVSKRAVWVKVSDCNDLPESSCVGSAINLMDGVIPIFIDSRIEFGYDEVYYSSYMNSYSDMKISVNLYLNRKLASALLARN